MLAVLLLAVLPLVRYGRKLFVLVQLQAGRLGARMARDNTGG